MFPKLNYKVFGEGEPVIILHGLFGMLDNWQTFAKALAKDYMVFLIDQRDHGRSEHTNEFNYQVLAEDLKSFLDEQWIYKARLIGHSMGGKTCLQLAANNEAHIQQMMIVDIGTKGYSGGHEQIINALKQVPINAIKSRSEATEILAKEISEPGIIQFLLKNLSRNPKGGYQWKMNLTLLANEYQNILEGVHFEQSSDVETLFVRGSRSHYILDEDIEGLKEQLPAMRLETLDAGHWVHAEKPKELLDLTKSFFKQQ